MNEHAQSLKRKDYQYHHRHHSQHYNFRLPHKQKVLLSRHGLGGDASSQQQLQKEGVEKALASPSLSSTKSSSSAVAAAASAMRDPSNRTKVVVRRLPPSLSQSAFFEYIQSRYAGLINWISFNPGKLSINGGYYSHAYIDFKHPKGVFDFYHGFDGHIFVNEKGTQYRALIEYAPHQWVPKLWSKKDMREGSILKDREYLDFLEVLAKPIEFLPSAEVQLERKEAARNSSLAVAGTKESIIVTPLMEYVRKKRASKSQRVLVATGKLSARRGSSSPATSSLSSKRGTDRLRANTMHAPISAVAKPNEKLAHGTCHEDNQQNFSLDTRRGLLEKRDKKLMQEPCFGKVGVDNQNIGASEHSGSHRRMRCNCTSQYVARELHNSIALDADRISKRGGRLSIYRCHEKQVWVAKSGSGS